MRYVRLRFVMVFLPYTDPDLRMVFGTSEKSKTRPSSPMRWKHPIDLYFSSNFVVQSQSLLEISREFLLHQSEISYSWSSTWGATHVFYATSSR